MGQLGCPGWSRELPAGYYASAFLDCNRSDRQATCASLSICPLGHSIWRERSASLLANTEGKKRVHFVKDNWIAAHHLPLIARFITERTTAPIPSRLDRVLAVLPRKTMVLIFAVVSQKSRRNHHWW